MIAIIVYLRTLPIKRFKDCINSFINWLLLTKNRTDSSWATASIDWVISNPSFAFRGIQDHAYHVLLHVFHACGR